MSQTGWNRCSFCGRFIGFAEFEAGGAEGCQVTPDSHFTSEQFAYWHRACQDQHERQQRDRVTTEARTWTY